MIVQGGSSAGGGPKPEGTATPTDAGVAVIAVTIASRLSGPTAPASAALLLDEPAGTRIAQVAALPDRLVLLLQGGGPDRVVMVDPRNGRPAGRISLAR